MSCYTLELVVLSPKVRVSQGRFTSFYIDGGCHHAKVWLAWLLRKCETPQDHSPSVGVFGFSFPEKLPK
jgi:hypothetical protein